MDKQKEIDLLIKLIKSTKNKNTKNTTHFDFGDVVLIRYQTPKTKGPARPDAKQIALIANQKNQQGVRTPKHLAIKREQNNEQNICWVLQEKSHGVPFSYYCQNPSPQQHIKNLVSLLSIPQTHYEKLVKDACALLCMKTQTKPKNIFYDPDPINGGFTFVDLRYQNNRHEFNGSFEDISNIQKQLTTITAHCQIPPHTTNTQQEYITKSRIIKTEIDKRIFRAMETVIPSFSAFKQQLKQNMLEK